MTSATPAGSATETLSVTPRDAAGASAGVSRWAGYGRVFLVAAFFTATIGAIVGYHLVGVDEEHIAYLEVEHDIYWIWQECVRVANGENPYVRIHGSDMRTNEKYATYFPGIYLLGAAAAKAGWDTFPEFIRVWRFPAMLGLIGMGVMVFVLTRRGREVLVPLLAVTFVWFNRWSIHNVTILHTDALAIFFFLLSLWLWRKGRREASALAVGVSLVIKHMAIFVLPLYLVWAWVEAPPEKRWRQTLIVGAWIAATPVLLSLPFLLDDPAAFIKSILFSATRDRMADHHSLDVYLGLGGLLARVPMFGMFFVVYYLAWRRRLTPYLAITLIFAVFVCFNNTLLPQYYVWLLTAVALLTAEVWRRRLRSGHVEPALPAGAGG